MMMLCARVAHAWGVRWDSFTKGRLGDIYEGDVVFRLGLKDRGWRLEILHHLRKVGQASCNAI